MKCSMFLSEKMAKYRHIQKSAFFGTHLAILYIFRCVRKFAKSDYKLPHVCVSVRPPEWNSFAPTGRIFLKSDS